MTVCRKLRRGFALTTAAFFGSPATNNMCSLCFKKVFSDKTLAVDRAMEMSSAPTLVAAPAPEVLLPPTPTLPVVAAPAPSVTSIEAAAPATEKTPTKRKANRCDTCKKKVGLTGITCRCGGLYCGSHRYAQQHACTFDYKASERAELAKRNPGGGSFEKMERV